MNRDDDKPVRIDRNQNKRLGESSEFAKLLAMFVLSGIFVISTDLIAVSNDLASVREDKWVTIWFVLSFAFLLFDLAQSLAFGSRMFSSLSWPKFRKARLTIITVWIVVGIVVIVNVFLA